MSRPTPWKIADLIDFECLLADDSGAEETRWRGRLPELPPGDEATARSRLFKAWLHLRRGEGGATLPGKSVASGWGTLLLLSLVAGLVLGASVTGALLHYKGDEPVNVSWFLACTVGVQMLVLAVVVLLALLRAATDWLDDFHPLRGLLAGLVWVCSAGLRRLPGEQRERLRASLAVLGRKREIYGSLAAWPFLIVTQLFAVGYNVGILALLLAHVSTMDLAFGWQSTLHLGPEAAYRIVSALAAPWAWGAPNAHPTLAEVIGSRFAYSEGIKPLDRAAMASWWPFLCYAVAFYGLLLRGALLVFAMVKLRTGLRGLAFDHEGCNALFRRLTGPVVQTQAETVGLEIPESAVELTTHAARGGTCLALVATDLELPAEQLTDYIGRAFGWKVAQTLPAQIDHPSGNADTFATVAKRVADCASIIVVLRARRAPIKAIALFLQKVAETAGDKPEVILLLVGRREGASFAPVEESEFKHWRNFQAIHGLRLSLEKWERGMSEATPTFAIVGAVNHGKSSVVSTLSENDQVRISSQPGETVECQRFELRDLFVFYDTPGFQNAIEALSELAPAAQAREPLAVFREFLSRHRADPAFAAETVLFQPVVAGAGIVYVVDGSEPLLEIHAAEMEILRLTGQPRLAIINRTSTDDHVADWKRRLGLHFNAVREFNAHHATFADRLELLETLAGIEQGWKPKLMQAVAIFREEWEKQLGECAEIIVELLVDALTHREVAGADAESATRRAALGEELKARYIQAVSAREARAHKAIIKLFGHNRVRAETTGEHLFDAGLFSDDTWRAFGLDERQLVAAGAIGGAAAGALFDFATVGHSLGIPTVVGTGVGALTGFVVGKKRPELKIKTPAWWPGGLRFGGSALSVGPYGAINFPWILLDRALGTFAYVINRAHARRDEAVIQSARMHAAMEAAGLTTARWDEPHRKQCEQLFTLIRRSKMDREQRAALRALFRERLVEISAMRLPVDIG